MLDDDERSLLRAVLRARPGDAAALRALADSVAGAGAGSGADALAGLERQGFLRTTGDRVEITSPDAVLGEQLSAHLDRLHRDVDDLRARAAGIVADLQDFAVDATLGGSARGTLALELFHGPEAPRDASVALAQRRGPVASRAVLPDASRLQAPPPEFLAEFTEMMRAQTEPDRVLLGPLDLQDTDLVATLDVVRQAGAQLRVAADLPGWFAVDADDHVALPVEWGDPWPSSVVVLRHPGVAGALRHLFETLWAAAPPLGHDDSSWEPLVGVLLTGASLAEAADFLGISERTARRRLDLAMRHHRARSLFQLGAAVARTSR